MRKAALTQQARKEPVAKLLSEQERDEPSRAVRRLAGWKRAVALAAFPLLALGTLALATQNASGGEQSEITASALTNPETPASVRHAANGATLPRFDVARISRDGVGVLAGRAMPESRVRILADGELWATVEADSRGEWALILDKPLRAGLSALALETLIGGESLRSPNTLVIMREMQAGAGGEAQAGFDAAPDVLAVLTPQAGSEASRVLQKPVAPNAPPSSDRPAVETVEFDTAGRGIVTGRAPAGHRVVVRLNDMEVAQLRADAHGRWALTLESALMPGAHRLEVANLDEKGRALTHNVQSFEIGDLVAPPPGGQGIALEMRQAFWAMVRASTGMERRYTLIFRDGAGRLLDAANAVGAR